MKHLLSQQDIDRIIKRFFHYGYSIRGNEYVGIVVYKNSFGAEHNNIVSIEPNDPITGQPLVLGVYSLCADCSWKEAFETYKAIIEELVPEIECIEENLPSSINDMWEFGWRNLDYYK